MSEVTVEKIEIKIGRKTISLTPAELKELREVIDIAFPRDRIEIVPSSPVVIPYPVWPKPYRYWEPHWYTNGTSGKTTSGTLCISSTGQA